MARTYGHIMSAIWNDPDFRALHAESQRVYLMLVTQADISSAGTLPLTIKRWSTYAVDTPSDALTHALSELVETRFVVIDGATEELLVRKFVKWDGGYSNSKRQPAITASANAVSSGKIRAALAIELNALGVPHALSDALPSSPSDTPRVVVTEVVQLPQPSTHNRGPEPIPARKRCERTHPPDANCGNCKEDRIYGEAQTAALEVARRAAVHRNDEGMKQLDADLAAPRDSRAFAAAKETLKATLEARTA